MIEKQNKTETLSDKIKPCRCAKPCKAKCIDSVDVREALMELKQKFIKRAKTDTKNGKSVNLKWSLGCIDYLFGEKLTGETNK